MGNKRETKRVIRILLVDDHVVMREGTRRILEEEEDFEVVAETDDGTEAVELAQTLAPDVVLMDIRIKGINGVEATRAIKNVRPETHVVALTGYDFDQYVRAMLKAGAVGYLLKSASSSEMIETVRAASVGSLTFGAGIAQKVAGVVAHKDGNGLPPGVITPGLFSDRELEILSLLAEGKRNNQIAEDLGVTLKTVEYHVKNLFAKLEVNSRIEAAMRAKALGLVPGETL
jgi:DNA-binding NarL/FixJ family response regulator